MDGLFSFNGKADGSEYRSSLTSEVEYNLVTAKKVMLTDVTVLHMLSLCVKIGLCFRQTVNCILLTLQCLRELVSTNAVMISLLCPLGKFISTAHIWDFAPFVMFHL